MNKLKRTVVGFGRYNKATAAALSQAAVQLASTFVRLDPELEQALGIVVTAALVWLVPNRTIGGSGAPPGQQAGAASVAHLPLPAMLLALLLGAAVAGCAALIPGDPVADRLFGPDCGPESRVLRARLITDSLAAAYPDFEATGVRHAIAAMAAAVSAGDGFQPAALAYAEALIRAVTPLLVASGFDVGLGGEPIWLRLVGLPPIAANLATIRHSLAAHCAGA
jgi:hypothetical protein